MQNQLNLYYIFYTAAKCGSISLAARELFISQPAVSKAISKLEESFGTKLFVRESRGVSLTDEGRILFQQLETAFCAIHAGEKQLRRNEELGVGKLSIGVSTTLCKYVLLPYLKEFIRENPHIRISISCQPSHETITALENGQLDIGLIGEPEGTGLSFYALRTITDVFAASRDYLHTLKERFFYAKEEHTEQELFSHATLLLLNRGNMSRQLADKYMLLHDITSEQQVEASTMDLLIDFARIGMGIACVTKDFIQKELEEGSLVLVPTKEPIPSRKIGFACSGKMMTPAMEKFLRMSGMEKLRQ